MSYQDHLRTCSDCQKRQNQKPTVRIKSASSSRRERKLSELASIIKGVSYPGISYAGEKKKTKAKSASMDVKVAKLRELAKIIKG